MADRPHQVASPNCGPRKGGILHPDMVVLHYTAMSSAEAAIQTLCTPENQVSAHYVIARNGAVTQLVDEAARAWHAGAGRWAGCDDINSRSIGIELDNDGASPFSAPLMDALEGLLDGVLGRWDIPAHHVIAHSDLAPTRKIDPGPHFDWLRLARQGMAVWPDAIWPDAIWPEAGGPDAGGDAPLDQSLARIGYAVDLFGLEACLCAFRLRFRPAASGSADATDRVLAANLAARFGLAGG